MLKIPPILIFSVLSLVVLALFAQPGSQAQTVPPTATAPSVYLPVVASFIPTATPTFTSTPAPTETPSTTPTPTNTPSHSGGDARAPGLVTWDFSPVSVDTAISDQAITFTAHITDDLSGVHYAIAWFDGPSGQVNNVWFFPSSDLVRGTPRDGIYVSVMILNRFSATGRWSLREIQLLDETGNRGYLRYFMLVQRGLPVSFQVTNNH